jgi:hypothetical protein
MRSIWHLLEYGPLLVWGLIEWIIQNWSDTP